MDGCRRRMIDRSQVAREGRRFHAFYRGCRDAQAGCPQNPFPPGSEAARLWQSGQEYAQSEELDSAPPGVCRLGPGGDYVRDWPVPQAQPGGKP